MGRATVVVLAERRASSIPACMFGDPNGTHTMVVYGDSHAGMWFQTLDFIATLAHWRLAFLGKGWCPADSLSYENPSGFGHAGAEYSTCDQWHRFAIGRIQSLHPDLVIVTQEDAEGPNGETYSPAQWQQGLEKTITSIEAPDRNIVVLGNIPVLESNGPDCLARNPHDVQACSSPFVPFYASLDRAEQRAATDQDAQYVNVTPWFCSNTCTAVIGKYEVYLDQYHVTAAYAFYLAGVLAAALPLPDASQLLRRRRRPASSPQPRGDGVRDQTPRRHCVRRRHQCRIRAHRREPRTPCGRPGQGDVGRLARPLEHEHHSRRDLHAAECGCIVRHSDHEECRHLHHGEELKSEEHGATSFEAGR